MITDKDYSEVLVAHGELYAIRWKNLCQNIVKNKDEVNFIVANWKLGVMWFSEGYLIEKSARRSQLKERMV